MPLAQPGTRLIPPVPSGAWHRQLGTVVSRFFPASGSRLAPPARPVSGAAQRRAAPGAVGTAPSRPRGLSRVPGRATGHTRRSRAGSRYYTPVVWRGVRARHSQRPPAKPEACKRWNRSKRLDAVNRSKRCGCEPPTGGMSYHSSIWSNRRSSASCVRMYFRESPHLCRLSRHNTPAPSNGVPCSSCVVP
jgi:hypothetical protein